MSWSLLSLGVAIALALAFDILSLRVGLWNDELTTIEFASGSFGEFAALASRDPSPPAYYFVMWVVLRVLPPGEVTVRLVSVAAHLGLVALVHRHGTRFHSPRAGLLAALACAMNPMMIWYATNGRAYALSCLAGMACVYAYRGQRWMAFAVWSALSAWLHFGAALCPALLVAWDLARNRRVTPAFKAALAAGAACVPLAYHFVTATARHHPPFASFDLAAWLGQLKWWAGLDALPGQVLLVLLPLLVASLLVRARQVPLEMFLWLGSSVILAGIASWHGSSYHPKFILWTLPVAQLAIAAALPGRACGPLGALWLAVVLAGALGSAGSEKSADRRTARWLAPRVSPRDRLLLEDGTRGAFRYYFLGETRTGSGAPATWYVHDRHDDAGRLAVTRVEGVGPMPATTPGARMHVTIEPAP